MSEVTREQIESLRELSMVANAGNYAEVRTAELTQICTLALERLDMDLEAAAKTIMEKTFNCYWESLNAESIKDRGYKPVIYNSYGGNQWQGGKADMIEIAKDALNAALKSTPTHFQEVKP